MTSGEPAAVVGRGQHYELVCDGCGTSFPCYDDSCYDWALLRDAVRATGWDSEADQPHCPHHCHGLPVPSHRVSSAVGGVPGGLVAVVKQALVGKHQQRGWGGRTDRLRGMAALTGARRARCGATIIPSTGVYRLRSGTGH